jgi:small-conductance mechanosensitive channel
VDVSPFLAAAQLGAQASGDGAATAESCGDRGVVCDWVYEWSGNVTLARTVDWIVSVPVTVAAIVIAALVLNRLARRAVRRLTATMAVAAGKEATALVASTRARERAAERARALESILSSTVTVAIFAVATVMVLERVGFDVVALLAGAGILGLAVSFGAQSFVRDMIAGIAILVEDQYGIGDDVDVGEAVGVVERVSLRSTVVRDVDGTLWYVPNGEIRRVANRSQLWSRIVLDLRVPYEADLDRARAVIGDAAHGLFEDTAFANAFRERPGAAVVQELAPDAVVVRQILWVRRAAIVEVERELRTRAKRALHDEGIGIAPPRQVVVLQGG